MEKDKKKIYNSRFVKYVYLLERKKIKQTYLLQRQLYNSFSLFYTLFFDLFYISIFFFFFIYDY